MENSISDSEYFEFLSEIEQSDDDLKELQDESSEHILQEESMSEFSEFVEDKDVEAYYGENAWRQMNGVTVLFGTENQRKANRASMEANKKRIKNLKEDRLQIQRMAFEQTDIDLESEIGSENIRTLVSLLVKEHTRMIEKHEDYINRRLTALLNMFIPQKLKACKILHPASVRNSPGFMYYASKEYGQGLTFWATPDIPFYFEQQTEQSVIEKSKPELLISIDKAIVFYYEHKEKRAKKEIKYASMIIQKKVTTYFDLLKLNPFWFKILYDYIKPA